MITGVMIVRDEEERILATLESFSPYVDRWVICDTGSTDKTQEKVSEYLSSETNSDNYDGVMTQDWPGSELLSFPFVDYSSARNRALQAADSGPGWLMMIDCDQRISGSPWVFRQALRDLPDDVLAASLPCDVGETRMARYCLVRSGVGLDGPGTPGGWHYRGVVHEALGNSGGGTFGAVDLPEPIMSYEIQDHARRLARWRERDYPLLRQAVRENPTDSRSLFYLGQTCQNLHEANDMFKPWRGLALQAYQKRAALGPQYHPDEELFHTWFRIGELLAPDQPGTLEAYLSSWALMPHRAEPLDRLSRVFLSRGQILPAWHFAQASAACPFPKEDKLFVDRTLYHGRSQEWLAEVSQLLKDLT